MAKIAKKTPKTKNTDVISWEPPKINLTQEKATQLSDLMKDKGIEYYMGSSLKSQVDAFMQGLQAGKKAKESK